MSESQMELSIKKRQAVLAFASFIIFILIVALVIMPDSQHEEVQKHDTDPKIKLTKVSTTIDPQEEWQIRSASEIKALKEEIRSLQEALKSPKTQAPDLDSIIDAKLKERDQDWKNAIELINKDINQIEKQSAKGSRPQLTTQPVAKNQINYLEGLTWEEGTPNSSGVKQPSSPNLNGITKHEVALSEISSQGKLNEKSLSSYLPAGSYVKARIISGVHASASVRSQSDPLPILFRLQGPATTAGYEKVDLNGCLVTGEAFGDISSERAFVRLHDMTCSRKHGHVIETKVKGYAAAKGTGIRGKVIRREGEFLKSSFWSGLLSGFGKAASEASTDVSKSPLGTVSSTTGADVFKNAAAEGVANAADRLSKYHIERAEQYHAVIEIKAGREVDLIFIEGVYLDGRSHEKN